MNRIIGLIAFGVTIGLLGGFVCYGQTNERLYEELDFRFVNPGARSVGMGKTFVGLADDATAAYSNPAGLSNLLEPEMSFEFTATQIKHQRFIPSDNDLTKTFGETVLTPSFFSYVVPKENFTFSFFRNVVQNYKEDFKFPGRFIRLVSMSENGSFGKISIQGVNYGLGLSYLLSPRISVGTSVMLTTLDFNTMGRSGFPTHPPRNGTDTNDSGLKAAGIFGILVKPTSKISIGAVYNTGSKFRLKTTVFGRFIEEPQFDVVIPPTVVPIQYVIPDRYSLGFSWKLNDQFTGVFDVNWIRYSKQITDHFLIFDFMNPEAHVTKDNFFIDDALELHMGAEYRMYYHRRTIAFRAGLFTDPPHQLRFRRLPNTHPFAAQVEEFRFNHLPQKTDVGFTVGGGIALSNRYQVDVAVSLSPDATDGVLSWVIKL